MYDIEKLAGSVIEFKDHVSIKHGFRLDTNTFEWVKPYLRDKKIRTEIKQLQQEIVEARNYPIHRDELREMFKARISQINSFRMQQIREHLSNVQQRIPDEPLITENMLEHRKFGGVRIQPYLIKFTDEQLDDIFSELPEGVPQKEIEKQVSACQIRISELEKELTADELNPRTRWIFRDDGINIPYPKGCRWTAFVSVWEMVAKRFRGNVNIEGYPLTTQAETDAFFMLGLNSVHKVTQNEPKDRKRI